MRFNTAFSAILVCHMSSDFSEPLNRHAVIAYLGADAAHINLDVRDTCDSTNSVLMASGPGQPLSLQALAVEHQTAGRGRRGRQWQSWPGGSLLFSVRWERGHGAVVPSGLSLAAGVAVAETLEDFGCAELKLKWPNDLLINGAKAGGILVEISHSRAGQAVVIGVGLNLRLPSQGLPDHPVADLFCRMSERPSRNLLLARLLQALAAMLREFDAQGFAVFCDRWNARNAHAGCEVVLMGEGVSQSGYCVGADADGALLLAGPAGVQRVLSGDASLRVAT